jgi:hypothetical protein
MWAVYHVNTVTGEKVRFVGIPDMSQFDAEARAHEIEVARGRTGAPVGPWVVRALPIV